jgi:hypothetical protein
VFGSQSQPQLATPKGAASIFHAIDLASFYTAKRCGCRNFVLNQAPMTNLWRGCQTFGMADAGGEPNVPIYAKNTLYYLFLK